jgi:integrase
MATILNSGMISFRHPLVPDSEGYGKVIRKGVGKLPKGEQYKIEEGIEKLLVLKPLTLDDVKEELHPQALKFWFDPLDEAQGNDRVESARRTNAEEDRREQIADTQAKYADDPPIRFAFELAQKIGIPDAYGVIKRNKDAKRLIVALASRLMAAQALDLKRLEEIASLKDQVVGVAEATGQELGERKNITLAQCFDHFKTVWKSPSQLAYDVCIQRVGYVIDAIGPKVKQVTVTRAMIESAIDGSKHSDSMKKRLYSVAKSFFTTLAYAPESNGLGLRNPAESMEIPTNPKMKPQITDPRTLLALPLSEYWKAFSAVVGFGGLRLAEAGALIWDHVDFDNEIIKVLPTEAYPELKSLLSDRPIKPFPNVWPTLKRWKKAKLHATLVFPRIGGEEKTGETWFRVYKDLPNAADLSAAFKGAINDALSDRLLDGLEADDDKIICEVLDSELDLQPAQKLRHWWETTMRANGYGGLIEDTGGHSDEVGRTHYTNVEAVVKAAKISAL